MCRPNLLRPPFSLQAKPSQSVQAHRAIGLSCVMQGSRTLITIIVLVASVLTPVLSATLECVVVPFISCDTADLFI